MKKHQFTPWLTACFLAAMSISCSPGIRVSTDFDKTVNFGSYKTFNIYNLKITGSVSQLNADRIVAAIKNEMISKGYTESGSNPDLMVNAVTILKDKQAVSTTTNYYGFGGLYRPYRHFGMGMSTGVTTTRTYDYKDGSLTIDMVDSKTQKMIWQGIGNKELDRAPKNTEEYIRAGVASILKDFPSAQK